MAAEQLAKAFERLCRVLKAPDGGLTDGQLLARFVAGRDEAAFEALVHRHGRMVLGVCRRVLRDAHDAEDAFQGTFLILARKAASVEKRDSVASWLYAVAYRTALEARAAIARRRVRERQVEVMPHPVVGPHEVQDWRPLLDRALARLPEKYRAAVVLCDLEGLPRKEAARRLGLPEGTLSSRLATARRRLAERLARSGVCLPVGVLMLALSEGEAAAAVPAVPAALVSSTVRAAILVAAGETAALTMPAAVLMKGALQTMFLQKLKVVAATAVVVLALGAGGLAYRVGGQAVAADKPRAGQPLSEVEALRKEVDLLRLNLQVVLEKVRSQEAELRTLRPRGARTGTAERGFDRTQVQEWLSVDLLDAKSPFNRAKKGADGALPPPTGGAAVTQLQEVEDAVAKLRAARDAEGQRHAADAVERAVKKLKEQMRPARRQDPLPR